MVRPIDDPAFQEVLRRPRVADQHYVSAFYLRYFADKRHGLTILRTADDVIPKERKSPKKAARERYYFGRVTGKYDEWSQIFEHAFGDEERELSRLLPPIFEKMRRTDALTRDDKVTVARLMGMLWARSPLTREWVKRQYAEIALRKIRRIYDEKGDGVFSEYESETGKPFSEQARALYRKLIAGGPDAPTLEPDNRQHLFMLAQFHRFVTEFLCLRWTVLVNRTGKDFITSDSPVCQVFTPECSRPVPMIWETLRVFPLTRDLCIEAQWVEDPNGKPIVRRTLGASDEGTVLSVNATIAVGAHREAYGHDPRPLEDILRLKRALGPRWGRRVDAMPPVR